MVCVYKNDMRDSATETLEEIFRIKQFPIQKNYDIFHISDQITVSRASLLIGNGNAPFQMEGHLKSESFIDSYRQKFKKFRLTLFEYSGFFVWVLMLLLMLKVIFRGSTLFRLVKRIVRTNLNLRNDILGIFP